MDSMVVPPETVTEGEKSKKLINGGISPPSAAPSRSQSAANPDKKILQLAREDGILSGRAKVWCRLVCPPWPGRARESQEKRSRKWSQEKGNEGNRNARRRG